MSIFIPNADNKESYTKVESDRRFERRDPDIVKLSPTGQTGKVIYSNGLNWGATGLSSSLPVGNEYSDYVYWDNSTNSWQVDTKQRLHIGGLSGLSNQCTGAIALGYRAGQTNQGTFSVAIGWQAGLNNQKEFAIAIGRNSGQTNQGGNAISIGQLAGFSNQNFNGISVGLESGYFQQGTGSIALGYQAGYTNQNSNSVAIGFQSGASSQGQNCVGIGNRCQRINPRDGSVAIGTDAGNNIQGTNSIAIGLGAGQSSQSSQSVAIGYYAGRGNQGDYCVAIGNQAGQTGQNAASIALGSNAGQNNLGTGSICIGTNAGAVLPLQTNCVAIGTSSMVYGGGRSSIAIGLLSGLGGINTPFPSNSIHLCAKDTGILDKTQSSAFYVEPIRASSTGVPLLYNSSDGEIVQNTSSQRFKTNIVDLPDDISQKLYNIRSVKFDRVGGSENEYGFLAEEMDQVDKNLVVYDQDNLPYGISYFRLLPILVKEIQRLKSRVDNLS